MISNSAATAFYSAGGLIVLWFLAFVFWRSYRIDAFRQDLFDLRDELFDLGASGVVPFADPAYFLLRRRINSVIRFAHKFTLTMLLVSAVLRRIWPRAPFEDKWEARVSEINPEAGAALRALHALVLLRCAFHMLYLPWPSSAATATARKLCARAQSFEASRRIVEHVKVLEAQAVEARKLELANQQYAMAAR